MGPGHARDRASVNRQTQDSRERENSIEQISHAKSHRLLNGEHLTHRARTSLVWWDFSPDQEDRTYHTQRCISLFSRISYKYFLLCFKQKTDFLLYACWSDDERIHQIRKTGYCVHQDTRIYQIRKTGYRVHQDTRIYQIRNTQDV